MAENQKTILWVALTVILVVALAFVALFVFLPSDNLSVLVDSGVSGTVIGNEPGNIVELDFCSTEQQCYDYFGESQSSLASEGIEILCENGNCEARRI